MVLGWSCLGQIDPFAWFNLYIALHAQVRLNIAANLMPQLASLFTVMLCVPLNIQPLTIACVKPDFLIL